MDLEDARTRVKFVLHDQGRQRHRRVRRRVPGRRLQGHPLRGPGAADELGHGALDQQLPARAAGPDPVLNQPHLTTVLREYEDFHNTHQPHRTLKQTAPLRPVPDGVTDPDHFRVQRRDRAGSVLHEYHLTGSRR